MNNLDKFTILTGSIGLIGDTIAIVGFATAAGLVIPNVKGFDQTPGGVFLFTGLVGFYSLTMVVWFLFRRKQLNPETKRFGFDELQIRQILNVWGRYEGEEDSATELTLNLIPIFGAFRHILANKSARVIFWIAVFISLFPAVFWLYLWFSQALVATIAGLFLCFLLHSIQRFSHWLSTNSLDQFMLIFQVRGMVQQ
jgi:hypothetical protein